MKNLVIQHTKHFLLVFFFVGTYEEFSNLLY